jgi:GTP-binding protein
VSSNTFSIYNAEFLFGAPSMQAIRPQELPEIAVAGRSNVGKSTFINRIAGRKLARVSGTPGATRELNFYHLEGAAGGEKSHLCLVDMPGFGYAKLSHKEREAITKLAVRFLRDRQELQAVILLNDCRREPQADELAIQKVCAEEGIHCIIVLTKFDKLRQNEKVKRRKAVAEAYNLEKDDVLYTGEKVPNDAFWTRVHAILS